LTDPFYAEIRVDWLQPNTWNPNKMNAFMYSKELQSIKDHGFIDPVTVRRLASGRYEIIDGQHRWQAARDLGYERIACYVLDVGDTEAKKLTILLNELRGQAQPNELGALLKDLLADMPVESLIEELPFTPEFVQGLTDLPPLPSLMTGGVGTTSPAPEPEKRWVERLYRMPLAAAQILDDATAKAKEGEAIEDWQALERIAADFLAS
jgi:hypothetical protein